MVRPTSSSSSKQIFVNSLLVSSFHKVDKGFFSICLRGEITSHPKGYHGTGDVLLTLQGGW